VVHTMLQRAVGGVNAWTRALTTTVDCGGCNRAQDEQRNQDSPAPRRPPEEHHRGVTVPLLLFLPNLIWAWYSDSRVEVCRAGSWSWGWECGCWLLGVTKATATTTPASLGDCPLGRPGNVEALGREDNDDAQLAK